MRKLPKFWQYATFPLVYIGGLVAAYTAVSSGTSLSLVFFAVTITAGLFFFFMELRYPRQEDWAATAKDYAQDFSFLIYATSLAMLLAPFKVYLSLAVSQSAMNSFGLNVGIWPHEWPLLLQWLLACLIGSFLRYWYHRAMHHWPRLWRIHALHHSPQKFGYMKTSWGHPLDSIALDLVAGVPLLVLGISPEALTLFGVTITLGGFVTHTALDLRTGPVAYGLNTLELHEVHHSGELTGDGHNYSDITPLWDHLFGTFYLDPKRVGQHQLGFHTWPESLPKPARILDLLNLPFQR